MKKKYNVTVNGEKYEVEVELIDDEKDNAGDRPVITGDHAAASVKEDHYAAAPQPKQVSDSDIAVRAPMPGTVLKVNVNPGDTFKKGQCLLILEAMKMENEIGAPEDGTVSSVMTGEGRTVAAKDVLIYYRK
jgi:biotin carboxyl carrier protein